MSDELIDIPHTFCQSMAIDEFREVLLRRGLNAEQCALLWRLTDRQGPAPEYLEVFVNRDDLRQPGVSCRDPTNRGAASHARSRAAVFSIRRGS